MQKILGFMRKAIQNYHLIQDGDCIGVGVSGGKDSLVLLTGLHQLQRFIGIDYKLIAITIDPAFRGIPGNYSAVSDYCRDIDVEYHIIPTQIGEIVFDVRKEPNPCSLCARMRRGALHNACVELGCNKLALGHNYDDTVETFLMNLFTEGRIGCYSPISFMERKQISVIRPLALAPEKEVRRAARKCELNVVKSPCPADGFTNRQRMKDFIAGMERQEKGFKDRIFGAMQRSDVDGWGIK